MAFHFSYFVTLAMCIVSLFVFRIYFNIKKKCDGFPFVHFVPSLAFDYVTGKIPKDVSFNAVIVQRGIEVTKQHSKEGFCMGFLIRPVLAIFGEEAMKVFSNEKAALDKSPEYNIVEEALGAGIATSNGNRWKIHRKIINPAFNLGALKEKVHIFNEHGMALIKDMDKLVGKPYVDVSESLKKHYFNSLSESVFGLQKTKENEARIHRLSECVDLSGALVVQRFFSPWLYPRFLLPLFPTGRLFNKTVKETDNIVSNIISEMKSHMCESEPTNSKQFSDRLRKSFAYILLNQHLNDPTFTLRDVHEEAKTMLLAGFDTVTYETMWCLYLLGLHPEIQEKAFEEVMSTTSYFITYEETFNLKYLNAIIMETLRIYPAVPVYGRTLAKDVKLGEHTVSNGTTIMFLPYILHRDSKTFPDPEEFKPERFLNGNLKESCNFKPFSEGLRSCIGKNFALLEMKIFLGHILRNFKVISLDKKDDINWTWKIVLTPEKPLRLKIIQRHNSFS